MRSTLKQLFSHWDTIPDDLFEGEGVDSVYLDFSRSFEKVEAGVLLHMLGDSKVLDVDGVWFGKFMDSGSRRQAVAVEGRLFGLSPVTCTSVYSTWTNSFPFAYLLH